MWPSRMFRRLHNAVPPHGDQDGELNDDPTSAASTTAAGPRVRLRRGQSSNVRASRSRQRVRQVQASSVQQETISSHSTNHQEQGEAEGDASPDSTIDEMSNRVSQSQPTATAQSGDHFHISRAATSTPAASREPRETRGRVLPASNVGALSPPAAVVDAIANFPEVGGLTVLPPSASETSIIYKWGVRVKYVEEGQPFTVWICLADDTCRQSGESVFALSHGRTSKATKHLASVHGVVSTKSSVQLGEKRKRKDELEHLRSSALYKTNPRRFNLLIETLRIVNNNLPFVHGKYRESRIIEALLVKDDIQATVNARNVTRAIIELYSSSRNEVTNFLASNRMRRFGNFVVMTDFWTSPASHKKYMAVRVYLVDANWELHSVLLGVRRFSPSYGDRSTGIRSPFKAWMLQVLSDFGLTPRDFFGATSDGGSDVKYLLESNLNLNWEWCIAHMAHAATKEACGMNGHIDTSRNPAMTELLKRMKRTIFDVQTIEKTGDLFAALCKTQTDTDTQKLLGYAPNRFLSVTGSIRRILEKWEALVAWYDERKRLAARQRCVPPVFPLAKDKLELEQLLSLLHPITVMKRDCQAEKPNQVDVLMQLYAVRLDTLSVDKPLKSYLSTRSDQPRRAHSSCLQHKMSATRWIRLALFQALYRPTLPS